MTLTYQWGFKNDQMRNTKTSYIVNEPILTRFFIVLSDLTDIMTNVRDHTQLKDAWKGWRDVSGRQMKKQYEEFVNLLNTAIQDGGKAVIIDTVSVYYQSTSWQDDTCRL